MIEKIKNNRKKLSVTFSVITILFLIQWIFQPIPLWRLEAYYKFRHNYQEYKQLTNNHGVSCNGKDGYISRISYFDLEGLNESDIATINSLSRLRFLEIHLRGREDMEMICAQMALLAKIDNENLTELQCNGWFDCLHLPGSVTTLRIRANMSNGNLMELTKFDQLKEILVYFSGVTATDVKAFNEIRPDVKVWWDGDINFERRDRDFWLLGHDSFFYE